MKGDLLICSAIDLSGADRFSNISERIVGSLALGKAGDVRFDKTAGALLAARVNAIPGQENSKIRRWTAPTQKDGSYTLLAGRLMERDLLAERLGCDPALDDASLYARAHMRWGNQCDLELLGEYAAIQYWPELSRARLTRSPLRAPPLHIWREKDGLVVASLPRSIFAAGKLAEVDPDRLADLALFNRNHPEHSLYKGMSRVPCGACELHEPGAQRLHRYWFVENLPQADIATPEQAVEAVDELFTRSARANLAEVRSPAISLSGGLDSQTSASYLIDAIEPRRLQSFTAVPVQEWLPQSGEGLIYDEQPRVEALAKLCPAIDPHFVEAQENHFGEYLDRMFLLGSWPTYNEMNMHWVHAIYRAARTGGSDVLFNADMGDAGFSYDGLSGFPTWLGSGRWPHLFRELQAAEDGRSFSRQFISRAVWPLLPRGLRRNIDKLRRVWSDPLATWCPLDPDHSAVQNAISRAAGDGHDIDLYQRSNAAQARAAMIAPTVSDGPEIYQALRLLHGIETRDLTAFRPLFEMCAGLPDTFHFREGQSRWLARKVAEGRVPEMVVHGTETAIQSADFIARVSRDGALIEALLANNPPDGSASSLIDHERLARDLDAIKHPDRGGPYAWLRLACALPRGVALSRFVRYAEGHNNG